MKKILTITGTIIISLLLTLLISDILSLYQIGSVITRTTSIYLISLFSVITYTLLLLIYIFYKKKNKEKIGKKKIISIILLSISLILILSFIVILNIDYLNYYTYTTSSPFYAYIIVRSIEFLLPSLILLTVLLNKKQHFKIIFIILSIPILLILIDTLQIIIFKNSPLISFRKHLEGKSYVDKGILLNTFYCVQEDTTTISWHFKTSKYTCPIYENINIKEHIENIINNAPLASSNPYDYINANKEEYQILLLNPDETFKYAINDLINNSDSLTGYIDAILCSDINKNFQYEFTSGKDYLTHYQAFLTECDCNKYDNYAKKIIGGQYE